jgi:hypothetical protein
MNVFVPTTYSYRSQVELDAESVEVNQPTVAETQAEKLGDFGYRARPVGL